MTTTGKSVGDNDYTQNYSHTSDTWKEGAAEFSKGVTRTRDGVIEGEKKLRTLQKDQMEEALDM